jgi:hypothetical protein
VAVALFDHGDGGASPFSLQNTAGDKMKIQVSGTTSAIEIQPQNTGGFIPCGSGPFELEPSDLIRVTYPGATPTIYKRGV